VCYLEKIVKLEGIVLRERNVVVDGERKRGSYDEGVHR
jgi:hypothetical protein